jgi:NADH-quinone oxidoreductase subunit G
MEFLLENHPLDCPVCDQAGECGLQDYSVEHGLDTTHMVDERRTFPGFERRMIGPHVVQNQNRCIHCTRCIRFTTEISETSDLTMKSRGNHSYIDTFDSSPFDNPWSACAADVCPVGALTVKEFRFRARVWHLEETPAVCPGCSIGCNIHLGHLDGVVHRFVPRANPEVNGWWMCDYGRFLAEGLNHRDVERPMLRDDDGFRAVSWDAAIESLADTMKNAPKPVIVASANLSNETLFTLKRHLVDGAHMEVVVPIHDGEPRRMKNGHGEWVESSDAHPNSTGARLLGLHTVDGANLEAYFRDSSGPFLVLDAHAHPWLATEAASEAAAGRFVAVLARTTTPLTEAASIVLPLASWAETEGTFTTSTGYVQLSKRAMTPRAQARPAWEIAFRFAVALGLEQHRAVTPRSLFAEMAGEIPAFAAMTWEDLAGGNPLTVRSEVTGVG